MIELKLDYLAKVSRALIVAVTVSIVLAGFGLDAAAQSIQGSVLGAVKDKSGAVVSGASRGDERLLVTTHCK